MSETQITEKQQSYLSALVSERDTTNPVVNSIKQMLSDGVLDRVSASHCITTVLQIPKVAKVEPVTLNEDGTFEPGVYDMKPGIEYSGIGFGKYVVVSPANQYGSQVGKALKHNSYNKSGVGSYKVSKYVLKSLANQGKLTKLDGNTVAALGKKFGVCMCCGALLTDKVSVSEGIGPTCKAKYGYLY